LSGLPGVVLVLRGLRSGIIRRTARNYIWVVVRTGRGLRAEGLRLLGRTAGRWLGNPRGDPRKLGHSVLCGAPTTTARQAAAWIDAGEPFDTHGKQARPYRVSIVA